MSKKLNLIDIIADLAQKLNLDGNDVNCLCTKLNSKLSWNKVNLIECISCFEAKLHLSDSISYAKCQPIEIYQSFGCTIYSV